MTERNRKLSLVAVLVKDYDEAIDWYRTKLGFKVLEDTRLNDEKRWVVVSPDSAGSALLLARAATSDQKARIGDQTGGRVFLFLETNDFQADYAAMRQAGVVFEEEPRCETYGTVAVFNDLYGNRWDLLELRQAEEN